MITVGIDIGSITTKAALMKDGNILATRVIFTGYNTETAGSKVLEEVLAKSGCIRTDIDKVVSTGYGRNNIGIADKAVTEITCHAAGAYFLNPEIRLIIDIGGQDSKVIALEPSGKVRDFAMNDKCAAGTGRFLEVMARAMEVDLDKMGELSLVATSAAKISSLCTVFAESEVISLISKGESRERIIAGIHESVATRVAAMAKRVGLTPPIIMTGGVAKNIGVVRALETNLKTKIIISQSAQENGAIGAAVIAAQLK